MALTLAQAQTGLANALAAHAKIEKAKKFDHTGSQVAFEKQNQDLDDSLKNIDYWDNKVDELTGSNSGLIQSQIAPQDDR